MIITVYCSSNQRKEPITIEEKVQSMEESDVKSDLELEKANIEEKEQENSSVNSTDLTINPNCYFEFSEPEDKDFDGTKIPVMYSQNNDIEIRLEYNTFEFANENFKKFSIELKNYDSDKYSNIRWGLKDRKGKILLDPKYIDIELGEFVDGIADIKVTMPDKYNYHFDYKYGYITKEGKWIAKPIYWIGESFKDGLAIIRNDSGFKSGIMNKEGKFILKTQYDEIMSIKDGIVRVRSRNDYGFIDIKGNTIAKPQFMIRPSDNGEFINGYTKVKTNDYKYKYLHIKGKIIDLPDFDEYGDFHEGLAYFSTKSKFGYIDTKGKIVIKPIYDNAGNFQEGLARVKINNKFGWIDKTGKQVIEAIYEDTFKFNEGIASVKINNKFGWIDKTGKQVIEAIYDEAFKFNDGIAIVKINNKYGWIDKTGNYIIEPKYDDAFEFNQDMARVKINNKYGYIDKTGKILIEPKYEDIGPISNGFVKVKENGKFGMIYETGEYVIKPQFDEIFYFSNGIARFRIDKKWGYINTKGQIVVQSNFDEATAYQDGILRVKKNGLWGFFKKPSCVE